MDNWHQNIVRSLPYPIPGIEKKRRVRNGKEQMCEDHPAQRTNIPISAGMPRTSPHKSDSLQL
jgi:hypothetical protein